MEIYEISISCPLYCEDLLKAELEKIGIKQIGIHHGAVSVKTNLTQAYRICLYSRIANNVFLKLSEAKVNSQKELYLAFKAFPFYKYFEVHNTFAIKAQLADSFLNNPDYASLVLKDAVVDSFRVYCTKRPLVDKRNPDIKLFLKLQKNIASLYLYINLVPLFKRGYRNFPGEAPLKENLAAAILYRAGFNENNLAETLVDFMCGSGIFLTEALLIAKRIAPGSLGSLKLAQKWKGHDQALWQKILSAAKKNYACSNGSLKLKIFGFDINPLALEAASINLKTLGLAELVYLKKADYRNLSAKKIGCANGLIVLNPPYGQRIKPNENLKTFYTELGKNLKNNWGGFKAAILCGSKDLARTIGLRASKVHTLYNGGLRCTLVHFNLNEANNYISKV